MPDEFLEIVHEIDHSPLTPNPELGAAIARLPGRKLILTNGTRRHAEAVMRRLEIDRALRGRVRYRRGRARAEAARRRSTTVFSHVTGRSRQGGDVRGSGPQP